MNIIRNGLYDRLIGTGELTNPKHKLLILGDSFGTQMGDNLSTALPTYKILNTSVSGFGPFEYLMEMRTKTLIFKPDIIILFYYAGNDLSNVQYNWKNKDDFKTKIAKFLHRNVYNLYIYHFYNEKKQLLMPPVFNYRKFERYGIEAGAISLARNHKINPWLLEASYNNKNYLVDNILIETENNIKAWGKVTELLTEMKKISSRLDSKFVIVIIPSTAQVNKSKYPFYASLKFNVDEKMLLSNRPQALLKSFCNDQGIKCLDLLPYFKAADGKELYLGNDCHLNKAGKELVTKITVDFLSGIMEKEGG